MDNPRIYIFNKMVIRTNTENSVEVRLFVPSLIHSFSLFIHIQSNRSPAFLTLRNFTHIKMCVYTYLYFLP